jgi:hypothetical protein
MRHNVYNIEASKDFDIVCPSLVLAKTAGKLQLANCFWLDCRWYCCKTAKAKDWDFIDESLHAESLTGRPIGHTKSVRQRSVVDIEMTDESSTGLLGVGKWRYVADTVYLERIGVGSKLRAMAMFNNRDFMLGFREATLFKRMNCFSFLFH